MQGARGRGALPPLAALAVVAAALIAGGCSKGEPESKQVKPNAPIESGPRTAASAPVDATVDDALKERLARQDAASRMFEKNVVQPAPPRAAEPRPAPAAAAPAPASPRPAPQEERPAPTTTSAPEPRKPPPVVATAPAANPAAVPPAAAAPMPAAPPKSAPARTDLAAAKPSAAPVPATPRLLTRVEPDFPTEAARAGVEQGVVHARLTLDGAGNVSNVEIVDSNPRRVFDRSVLRALAQWKFNEGAAGRTVESEIAFRK